MYDVLYTVHFSCWQTLCSAPPSSGRTYHRDFFQCVVLLVRQIHVMYSPHAKLQDVVSIVSFFLHRKKNTFHSASSWSAQLYIIFKLFYDLKLLIPITVQSSLSTVFPAQSSLSPCGTKDYVVHVGCWEGYEVAECIYYQARSSLAIYLHCQDL